MITIQEQRLAARIALRNICLYKLKSLTIGSLIGFGTLLIVLGLNLLRNVENSMQESIISSVAGHIQIYTKDAKDKLALFGGSFMGREDLGTITNFETVSREIEAHPDVAAVVPMGLDMAILGRGNELDEVFDALRLALKQGNKEGIDAAIDHARHQISIVKSEVEQLARISSNPIEQQRQLELIAITETPAFWQNLVETDREQSLQFLETKIAQLSGEKQPIYLRYLGTDIHKFIKNFKKFEIREGEITPEHTRGIMLSHKFREDFLKNVAARYFDKLFKAVTISKKKIEGDAELRLWTADLARQHMQILVHLDNQESQALRGELAEFLKTDAPLEDLVKSFLKVDDNNIVERNTFFYKSIAPRIKLYEINIGETLVLRSYTRSGFLKTLPIKVNGVYGFAGLEDSDLAGGFCLIDLVSFRELFGEMNEAAKKELDSMREGAAIKDVTSENVEDTLFGSDAQLESTSTAKAPENNLTEKLVAARTASDLFLPTELTSGLALNLAVVLKEGSAGHIDSVIKDLTKTFDEKKLNVKAVDWQEASGFVGQFVGIVRIVLVIGVLIVFLVALVIINNTLVVATLNRTREIGTMRAIGAQKSFVMSLFLWETFGIAAIGAAIGTLIATILLLYFKSVGIPAAHDVVVFLFSGLRLYPTLQPALIVALPIGIVTLAVGSSLYSARFATRVSPVTAMQEKE